MVCADVGVVWLILTMTVIAGGVSGGRGVVPSRVEVVIGQVLLRVGGGGRIEEIFHLPCS